MVNMQRNWEQAVARRMAPAIMEYLSINSDRVFRPSVFSVREFLMVLRLSAATVTETAATTVN